MTKDNNYTGEEALTIHYFLIKNGFSFSPGETKITEVNMSFTFPTYEKGDFKISFDEGMRLFIIKEHGNIIFKVDNSIKSTPNGLDSDWTVNTIGDEITIDDVIPFFREDKLKDLFKDV